MVSVEVVDFSAGACVVGFGVCGCEADTRVDGMASVGISGAGRFGI